MPVVSKNESGWKLLQQIRGMPQGKPVSITNAWRILYDEVYRQMWADNMEPDRVGTSTWIMNNKIKWLSAQGYQVILDGSEFEILEESPGLSAS